MADYHCHGQELLTAIKFFSDRNWTPATSSNFSYRYRDEVVITRSGRDKSDLHLNDLILVNQQGEILEPASDRPSAETLIHCEIYRLFPQVQCVLHTHSVTSTVLSKKYLSREKISFEGFEVQKGIAGNNSHQGVCELPILSNSQNMTAFCQEVKALLRHFKTSGFLMAGHGLYAWGESIFAAKRHIETYEFLLECLTKELTLND